MNAAIPIPHLADFWRRAMRLRDGGAEDPALWNSDMLLLGALHLNRLETLRFLYERRPSYEAFESWILERNDGAIAPERIVRANAAIAGGAPVVHASAEPAPLGIADLEHFAEHGYVIVRNAVPLEDARAAESALWAFLGMDRDDPQTWYGGAHGHSIWVPALREAALRTTRESPRLARAFVQLWGRDDLIPTVDQAGFNPPERPDWLFPGPRLHWDTSLAMPMPFGLQGILYLTETAEDQGAFTCVPGFHRTIASWLAALPPGTDPRSVDLTEEAVPIAAHAGDAILWHHALPHGSSPNRAARPRMVQYVSMMTPDPDDRPWL